MPCYIVRKSTTEPLRLAKAVGQMLSRSCNFTFPRSSQSVPVLICAQIHGYRLVNLWFRVFCVLFIDNLWFWLNVTASTSFPHTQHISSVAIKGQ
jgi:hypothetical protein